MGQYYKIVNLDKRQYLYPHYFGDGAKLLEFGDSRGGMMCGLAVLLADGNGRGGGDLRSDSEIIGSWAGDRIVVTGDYADPGKFLPEDATAAQKFGTTLYTYAGEQFTDISHDVIRAMLDDQWLAEGLKERLRDSYMSKRTPADIMARLERVP